MEACSTCRGTEDAAALSGFLKVNRCALSGPNTPSRKRDGALTAQRDGTLENDGGFPAANHRACAFAKIRVTTGRNCVPMLVARPTPDNGNQVRSSRIWPRIFHVRSLEEIRNLTRAGRNANTALDERRTEAAIRVCTAIGRTRPQLVVPRLSSES